MAGSLPLTMEETEAVIKQCDLNQGGPYCEPTQGDNLLDERGQSTVWGKKEEDMRLPHTEAVTSTFPGLEVTKASNRKVESTPNVIP